MRTPTQFFDRLNRLSAMREVGYGALISGVLLIALTGGLYFFTEDHYLVDSGEDQFLEVRANHVKESNAYFHHFLENIRKNKGVLILGTSESVPMDGFNYWELLNADPEIDNRFSVFYGAGRFCEMYIPLILSDPAAWKEQEVLVFVNPTYWRETLNHADEEYLSRYLNDLSVEPAREDLGGNFDSLYGVVYESPVSWVDKLSGAINNEVHSLYYNNLKSVFGEDRGDFVPFDTLSIPEDVAEQALSFSQEAVDSAYNAWDDYLHLGISPELMPLVDKSSDYRYTALEEFIEVCSEYDVDVTFVLGPYNGVLAGEVASEETVADYEQLMQDLRNFFEAHEQKLIDASDLSERKWTFKDAQHHSKYGAYLIYERIKEEYE